MDHPDYQPVVTNRLAATPLRQLAADDPCDRRRDAYRTKYEMALAEGRTCRNTTSLCTMRHCS